MDTIAYVMKREGKYLALSDDMYYWAYSVLYAEKYEYKSSIMCNAPFHMSDGSSYTPNPDEIKQITVREHV